MDLKQRSVDPEPSRAQSHTGLPEPVRITALVVFTGALMYLCWLIARPFVGVATWALALAVMARPWHARLERRMRPTPAALTTVILVALILILPTIWLGRVLVQEASDAAKTFQATFPSKDFHAATERFPLLQRALDWLQARNLEQELQRLAGLAAGQISDAVRGSIWIVTQFLLTTVALFFFLRDREPMLTYLRRLSPLSSRETSILFHRAESTIHSALSSNLLVKFIQGFLGGLMFWVLGLPGPVLFGAAMALLALLPIMGTALVWGPAAIALAVTGSWIKAIVLAVWGLLVVSSIDNVLYPMLVADELRIHPLAVFFAVFGGLIAFGFTGLVLGPLLLAITALLVEIWSPDESAGPLEDKGGRR